MALTEVVTHFRVSCCFSCGRGFVIQGYCFGRLLRTRGSKRLRRGPIRELDDRSDHDYCGEVTETTSSAWLCLTPFGALCTALRGSARPCMASGKKATQSAETKFQPKPCKAMQSQAEPCRGFSFRCGEFSSISIKIGTLLFSIHRF